MNVVPVGISKSVSQVTCGDACYAVQYPGWLQSHRDRISREEYTRYERQHQLMLSIVQEFEAEQSTDLDDVKRQRFERVLDIMQQMQSLGHPPKELIGELVRMSS